MGKKETLYASTQGALMSRLYHHLSLAERETITRMRDAKVSVARIAEELGRHPATIYRELRRNFFYDDDAWFRGYFGRVAHRKAASRRLRGGKVMRDQALLAHIVDRLAQCWSPASNCSCSTTGAAMG